MTPQNLQSVKKKIYAVCPELIENYLGLEMIDEKSFKYVEKLRCTQIPQLHHVLRAIPDNYIEVRISKPFLLFVNHDTGTSSNWNLLVNLDGQSEEVWKFLDKIL